MREIPKGTQRAYSKLLLSCASSAVLSAMALSAVPAFAQDADADTKASDTDKPKQDDAIIVTGSRIQRADYENNSPTVTVDQALLTNSSTAAIESNLNKLPQFVPAQTPYAGGDIQPTATNTPGAATISLRGIGSNRNLVLIDGRRSTPSNASGVVDISTIPSAAIERVEIISGGASATYGADAVAGVTNFILKKNVNGLELDGQAGMSEHGDGLEYQLSGIMGADFDDGRGNVSIAMSMNRREASYQRNRSWYRDLWANPDVGGTSFFLPSPGVYFGYDAVPDAALLSSMFPNSTVPNSNVTVYANSDGTPFINGSSYPASNGYAYTPYFEGFDASKIDNYNYKVTSAGTLAKNNTNAYLVLPLTRYNFFARGNYEINDWIGVFAQALFSHVSTYTRQDPGPITSGWDVSIDPTTLDQDQLPSALWDLLNSRTSTVACVQGDGCYNADSSKNGTKTVSAADAPFDLRASMPDDRETFTDVTTYNMLAGFQGFIPGTDWTWDLSVNHGSSETFSRQTGVYSLERLRTLLNSGNFGEGFSATGNAEDGGFGASSATCTTGMNFFTMDPSEISEDCYNAVRADLKNRSTVNQTIVEANMQGKLLSLPAGDLRAAVGASYRKQGYEFLNDTLTSQGTSFEDQALGIYPSGDSFGSYNVKEIYGELLVPVIGDLPGIKNFSLELGGRVSDYSTTGTSYTYKALGDWEVNDWLRFRGGYNRAERAPNIGELYLASQETFGYNFAGDPCSTANPLSWSANPGNATGAQVKALCTELMNRSGKATAADTYYAGTQSNSTFGFAWPTLVGNPDLTTEKANTWTLGMVLKSPFEAPLLSRLKLTLDWYSIQVKDAIAPLTVAAALQECLDPAFNPLVLTDTSAAADTAFCKNIERNQNGAQGTVYITYTNSGRFSVQGVDLQLDWSADVGPGTLGVNVLGNYLIDFKSAALPSLPMVDYAGTFGTNENGLNQGAFRWKLLTNISYSIGKLNLGLQWQHLPSVEDSTEATVHTSTVGAPAYNLFGMSANYALTNNFTIRFGIDNMFNKAPPLTNYNPDNTSAETTGQLIGGGYQANYYDTNGRSFYLGANAKF